MNRHFIEGKYDPFNLNAILFDNRAAYGRLIPDDFKQKSFLWCFLFVVKELARILVEVPLKCKFASIRRCQHYFDNSILFFLPTANNVRSLGKVLEIVSQNKNNVVLLNKGLEPDVFPLLQILLVSIKYLPILKSKFEKCSEYKRRVFLYYKYDFIYASGVIWLYHKILSNYRPECVVLSNDHRLITKSLELVCEDFGIKTIYVQHASVSYAFPELHFAYSFLDGMDSFIKYADGGKNSHGSVFLLGAARYDTLSNYRINREHRKRNSIGIAINLFDSDTILNDCCNKLLEYYPDVKLKIRSHPLLKNCPFHLENTDRIIYTCATDESIVDYLDSIDIQIGGDSGVHLDAIIGGVKTIAFNLSCKKYGDNYGYVKNGLISHAEDIKSLYEIIDRQDEVDVIKVRFYDESFGKDYSGHCSDIIANFILHEYDMDFMKTNIGFEQVAGDTPYFVIPN